MPPKVKSEALPPPDAMASQPEDIAQHCELPVPLPKAKRTNTAKKLPAPEPSTETDPSQALAMSTPKRGKACAKSKTATEGNSGQPAPGTPGGRPSTSSLFISAVANKCSVHQNVVETVLLAVETLAVQALREKRKFNVPFIQG